MAVSDSGRLSPQQRCLSGLSVLLMGSTYPLANPFPDTLPLIPVRYAVKIRVCPLILIQSDVVHQGTIAEALYSGASPNSPSLFSLLSDSFTICLVMLTRECVELAVSNSSSYSFNMGNKLTYTSYVLGWRLMILIFTWPPLAEYDAFHHDDSTRVEGHH